MNKPFLKAGYIGILLAAVSIALLAINPSRGGKLPQGFINPVTAFEFISTETEVYDLFGSDPSNERAEFVNRMVKGTYLDFFYMIVYTVFLLFFTGVCSSITGRKWFLFGSIIAWGVFISDFGENLQLLSIISKLQSGNFSYELDKLNMFTRAKWGGLSALFISIIPFLRKCGSSGRMISVAILLSSITGAAAFLHRSFLNEVYVLSIAVIFMMLIIFSFRFTFRDETDM
jgi:hypothetical protein